MISSLIYNLDVMHQSKKMRKTLANESPIRLSPTGSSGGAMQVLACCNLMHWKRGSLFHRGS